jgi:Sugar-binding N-terminal domain
VSGYTASDLKDFISCKSGGTTGRGDLAITGLTDITPRGPSRIRDLLAGTGDGTWVAVNATKYSDLETVACWVLPAERAGRSSLFRSGPSFVRALAGLAPMPPLR